MLNDYFDNYFDTTDTYDFTDFHKYQVTSYSANIAPMDNASNDSLSSHDSDDDINLAVWTRMFNQTI